MPTFVFRLHDGPEVEPVLETVRALDEQDARHLAELRLMLSRDFTHVEVHRDGQELFRLRRDSQPSVGRQRNFTPGEPPEP